MKGSQESKVEEAVIRRLEALSIFLGSHPEVVDSMTVQEISEELWDLGVSPQQHIDLAALTPELASGPQSERVSLALGDLIGDDLAVRSDSLRRLFVRLQEIEGTECSWTDRICTNPKGLSQHFDGAQTAEEFLSKNDFAGSSGVCIDLELAEEYKGRTDPSHISIVALYPSGAIRSVPSYVSLSGRMLHVRIRDLLAFLDPDDDQPTENIRSFWAPVTLFAVQN